MSWRPEEYENPYLEGVTEYGAWEDGFDEAHKADVSWLIKRIIHDDRGYIFKMPDKEWQEFIGENY